MPPLVIHRACCGEARAGRRPPGVARVECRLQRGLLVAAGREAQRKRHASGLHTVEGRPAGLHDVAHRRAGVRPVHLRVLQVGPAVAGTQVAAGRAREPRPCRERAGGLVVRGQQGTRLRDPGVVVAAVAQSWVVQHVHLVGPAGERFELHIDQQRITGGVGDIGLGQAETTCLVGIDLAIGQRAVIDQLGAMVGAAMLEHGERLAVGDDELQVPHTRRPQIRKVDLSQAAIVESVPHAARQRFRGAEPVLVGLRPRCRIARRAGRHSVGGWIRCDGPGHK